MKQLTMPICGYDTSMVMHPTPKWKLYRYEYLDGWKRGIGTHLLEFDSEEEARRVGDDFCKTFMGYSDSERQLMIRGLI